MHDCMAGKHGIEGGCLTGIGAHVSTHAKSRVPWQEKARTWDGSRRVRAVVLDVEKLLGVGLLDQSVGSTGMRGMRRVSLPRSMIGIVRRNPNWRACPLHVDGQPDQ